MTSLASGLHKAKAKPLTCFAMSMRRAAIIMCMADPEAISVSIDTFVPNPRNREEIHQIISDASAWKICAALYHPVISTLLAWSEYRLPYNKDIDGRYQGRREYLVFSVLLMVKYTKKHNLSKTLSSISGKMIIKGH